MERLMGVLRVIDAAANRAREGIRVIEDYVRFVLDDRHLTEQLKRLRHDLAAALLEAPIERRLAARETQGDIGAGLTVPGQQQRRDAEDVLSANFARIAEALRSLEEFGKTLDTTFAARMEQLRYRSYTLERAVTATRSGLVRLGGARLYVLIDGRATADDFAALVRSLVEAGVDVIQLRDKQLDDRTLLARARALREIARESGTICVVNDRPDLAVLAGMDGVHVGQDELTVKDVRSVVGPGVLIGVSTHSLEQARQAVLDGADYLGVGPTFPSTTKQFDRLGGIELVRAVTGEIRLPTFAIGGIHLENVEAVLSAGATRIAVLAAVTSAPDPAVAARALLARLKP
jgi:thiamine-phosphate pyrophosphorylase